MDLLLCIVEANAAAKALGLASVQCLHIVEDCSVLTETCNKVLPAALSIVESADYVAAGISSSQTVECVQGLTSTMMQLKAALGTLGEHESEGVLGILLEHPAAWLETYRGFRGLTAQLVGLSCIVRAAAQRRCTEDTEESLQASVKALMAICARARDAATLIGTDLPVFARTAAGSGWSSSRISSLSTAAAASSALHCHCHGHGHGHAAVASCRGSSSSGGSSCDASPARADLPSAAKRIGAASGGGGSILKRMGSSKASGSSKAAQGSSSASSPDSSSSPNTGSPSFSGSCRVLAHPAGGMGSLDEAACSLVSRVHDAILHDSELDHLEQDRAYLAHRVEGLREHVASAVASASAPAPVPRPQSQSQPAEESSEAPAGSSSAAAAAAAAAVSLVQSEVLLAAVDARLATVRSGGGDGVCTAASDGWRGGGVTVTVSGSLGGSGSNSRRASTAPAAGGEPVGRKRRGGIRWLPTCFVGA